MGALGDSRGLGAPFFGNISEQALPKGMRGWVRQIDECLVPLVISGELFDDRGGQLASHDRVKPVILSFAQDQFMDDLVDPSIFPWAQHRFPGRVWTSLNCLVWTSYYWRNNK